MKKNIVCPHCGKTNTWRHGNPFRPFCSQRCKLIDLGGWADEKYRIEQNNELPSHTDDEEPKH